MNGNSARISIVSKVIDTLYSLEKLIEWKRFHGLHANDRISPLYSLEKLIEWKLFDVVKAGQGIDHSLLAREIN